jgi:hypothetical protein
MDIQKKWILRAFALLDSSLHPVPQELNELDWKEELFPKADKLILVLSCGVYPFMGINFYLF